MDANSGTNWVLVVSIITLVLIASGMLWGIIKWYCRKRSLRNPIEVYYEPKQDDIRFSYEAPTSTQEQRCQITLRTKTELYVQFVRLNFSDDPDKPIIKRLWDWQWKYPSMPHYVNVHSIPRGWWFWEYDSPYQRRKGKRITIGIEFLAEKPYQGNLEVAVTANECDHNLSLSFVVNK